MANNMWILLALVAGTLITRFLPFLVFPAGKETPRFIEYLGQKLPYASMGLLVVYCLKGVHVTTGSHGIPELIAVAVTAGLQVWRKNVLLSISVGTIIYMLLIQLVF
ncbi:MAG: branched-chain amino acid transporter permease [Lachnospiraceae bacterium]|jgi:branched-subunit amino acid transport protein AzlD|nr:branched-chain amino acid transporter permease [Lachnospiraceae bacterium]MDD3617709.1 branched-chain amino acid transporter permease [Lachnospiraceae bacterium]